MFNSLPLFLLAISTAHATPKTNQENRCGPLSNCETVSENGTTYHRFKRGNGPGTPDYVSRFKAHEIRGDPIKTFITLGKSKIGWGCDQPLDPIFREGIKQVCSAHGCAEDTSYTRDVEWVDSDNARSKPRKRTLELKAAGDYYGQSDLDNYIEAFVATATKETVGTENRKWCDAAVSHWLNGSCKETGTCPMRMFPSFIKIARFQDENLKDHIDVTVSTSGGDGKFSYLTDENY
ncbi:uncharacterized protein N0V89_007119 [Didymosphaeria variabile]|uniref:Uncharacterized protein n=1 Tax=Didymosphaeria variabile TaxID=1932322 RepID=A0A9W9CAI5_9PLEO|nr:uncharacterized protein N0V89_007119 [Didymosphaeria variabile]KAJ4351776.1 hypothetical protein N0V89_007119 [Didymosphaeria variabile]